MSMKLILRTDVENLGRLGDIVTVKPGYGRNFLIPQGMAMPASPANLKVFEQERKRLESEVQAQRDAAMSLSEKIESAHVEILVRVGEGDRLYGSVNTMMIGDALAEAGVDIDRRKIVLESPIRALGDYEVPVKLHADVVATLNVSVVNQDPEARKAAEEAKAAAIASGAPAEVVEQAVADVAADAPAEAEAEAEESVAE